MYTYMYWIQNSYCIFIIYSFLQSLFMYTVLLLSNSLYYYTYKFELLNIIGLYVHILRTVLSKPYLAWTAFYQTVILSIYTVSYSYYL